MSNHPVDTMPLPVLHTVLVQHFGENWFKYEEETLSLELSTVFSNLLLQKIRLLKVLLMDADTAVPDDGDGNPLYDPRIEADATFFIHACDIMNNQVVDPNVFSMPTSLEVAYAIYTLFKLPIHFHPSKMVELVSEQILKNDGFQVPVPPFEFVPESHFSQAGNADAELASNQKQAIQAYIYLMENYDA